MGGFTISTHKDKYTRKSEKHTRSNENRNTRDTRENGEKQKTGAKMGGYKAPTEAGYTRTREHAIRYNKGRAHANAGHARERPN